MMQRLRDLFRQRTPEGPPDFGFALVGLGHGAEKFIEALQGSATVRVSALVSDHLPKATSLARKHGITHLYTYADFDSICDNPAVDAVYLALPNALHREFTERAAAAGKHVLCEKPMASTIADCHAMIEACQAANRLLMIGYRCVYDPLHQKLREILHSGALGTITMIESGFGFHAKPGWRLDPKLAGGGSLYDVGVYSINTIFNLFGEELSITSATITRDPASGMEMATRWQGSLASGATVRCHSSYLEKIPDYLRISATQGTLELRPAFAYQGTKLRGRYVDARSGDSVKVSLQNPRATPSSFRLEAEHLAQCVRTGTSLRTSGELGLRDMETIAQIYALAKWS